MLYIEVENKFVSEKISFMKSKTYMFRNKIYLVNECFWDDLGCFRDVLRRPISMVSTSRSTVHRDRSYIYSQSNEFLMTLVHFGQYKLTYEPLVSY